MENFSDTAGIWSSLLKVIEKDTVNVSNKREAARSRLSDIRDVARAAGVSIGTVSRVLNNSGPVKESTRQRVAEAIRKLSYVPNPMAQSMRTGRSQSLGALVPNLSYPFFTELVTAIERICNGAGHTLVICSARENDDLELSHLHTLVNRQVDGLLVSTVSGHQGTITALHEIAKNLPVVLIDRVAEHVGFSTVTVDGYQGVVQAVRYLAQKGHRRIAYIGFPEDRVLGQERLRGYLDAMTAAGLPVSSDWVTEGDLQVESGFTRAVRLLTLTERPTAFMVANDMMAIGAMRAVREAGLAIPADVAVIGFDNVPVAQLVDPPLTTVAQPIEEMGTEAVNLVLRKITQPSSRNRHLLLQTYLVTRGSA